MQATLKNVILRGFSGLVDAPDQIFRINLPNTISLVGNLFLCKFARLIQISTQIYDKFT